MRDKNVHALGFLLGDELFRTRPLPSRSRAVTLEAIRLPPVPFQARIGVTAQRAGVSSDIARHGRNS
jgi:hypothetical protein